MAGTGRGGRKDPITWAIPLFFGSMWLEYRANRAKAARDGASGGTYERRDTAASLTMGTLSIVAPLVLPRLLRGVTPGRGRGARYLAAATVGAAAAATAADRVVRRCAASTASGGGGEAGVPSPTPSPTTAATVAAVAGTAAVGGAIVLASTGWATLTSVDRLWRSRFVDLGNGPLAWVVGLVGWDLIYYWNHREMHQRRLLWAIHVVHHSSEHYNLSTALRQTVLDTVGVFVPYAALCLVGVSPELVLMSRGVNLVYQYWIHTEAIDRLGPAEAVLNSPSAHRVHHGVEQRYLDRNHGGILITWDKLFGTYTEETTTPTYGLTKNLGSFNPLRIATHEWVAMGRDVARSRSWRDRVGFVVRGPGWATARRAALTA